MEKVPLVIHWKNIIPVCWSAQPVEMNTLEFLFSINASLEIAYHIIQTQKFYEQSIFRWPSYVHFITLRQPFKLHFITHVLMRSEYSVAGYVCMSAVIVHLFLCY